MNLEIESLEGGSPFRILKPLASKPWLASHYMTLKALHQGSRPVVGPGDQGFRTPLNLYG